MKYFLSAMFVVLLASTTVLGQSNMWKKGLVLEAIRIDIRETPSGMQIWLNDVEKNANELNEYLEQFPPERKPICAILCVGKTVTAGQIAAIMDKLCDTGFNYPMLIVEHSKHSHLVDLGGAEKYMDSWP